MYNEGPHWRKKRIANCVSAKSATCMAKKLPFRHTRCVQMNAHVPLEMLQEAHAGTKKPCSSEAKVYPWISRGQIILQGKKVGQGNQRLGPPQRASLWLAFAPA